MTTAQRESVVQRVGRILDERIGLVRWFRHNACMKHGLPLDDNSEVRVVVEGNSQAPTPLAASPPAATPDEKSGLLRWIADSPGWLKGATLLAAGYAANAYLSGDGPAPVQQTEQVEQVLEAETAGSLLQDLEDRGFHVAGDEP